MSDRWAAHEELAAELEVEGADLTGVASRLGVDAEEALAIQAAVAALQDVLAADASDEALALPTDRIGDYELLGRLGHGAFGTVYRARDPVLDVEVAVKLINAPPGAAAEVQERLLREARAVAKLDHPNVVSIRSAGVADGRPYLVLDLVRGESLQTRLDQDGPLPVRRAVTIARDLAHALEHAHGHGVLHRDVKPDNVLIAEDGRPLLTDFGLAKDALAEGGSQLTQEGHYLGTPGYWPPEQARGDLESIGPHSDVYGLGATLYALLTGRPPFVGASVLGILESMARGDEVPAPRARRPEVPPGLEAICLRCLARAPEERYASAEALASALTSWLKDPDAAPTGPPPTRRKLPHVLFGALLAVAVSAVALLLHGKEVQAPPAPPVSSSPVVTATAIPAATRQPSLPASVARPHPWARRELAASPPARANAALVYDPRGERVLLFGGLARREPLNDLWSWDGVRWTELHTEHPPAPRSHVAAVFDARRGCLVVIGGRLGRKRRGVNELWEWDGGSWRQRALPDDFGSLKRDPQATYDARRAVTVVLTNRKQLAEWDGTNWVAKPSPPSAGSGLVWDASTGYTLLVDSKLLGMWGYDGVRWTMAAPPPPTTAEQEVLTVGAGDSVLLHGGLSEEVAYARETWLLQGGTWRQIEGEGPGPRAGSMWAWDASRGTAVLFGGTRDRRTQLADTWELVPNP